MSLGQWDRQPSLGITRLPPDHLDEPRTIPTVSDAALFAFLRAAPDIGELESLNDEFAAAVATFGFHAFAFVHFAAPGMPISPRPLFGREAGDWGVRYAREGLALHDPTLKLVFSRAAPFAWSDLAMSELSAREVRVFTEAGRAGLRDGYIVPMAGAYGEITAVVLMGDRTQTLNLRQRASLNAAAIVYATCGRSLYELTVAAPDPVRLTRRESQCLAWSARGKTDWEIGAILGISPRTVGAHIDNARAKLDVPSRTQAAFEAWRRGLLVEVDPENYGFSRIN